MNEAISCVGMDVHKDSIFVAVISPDGRLEEWRLDHTAKAVDALLRKLKKIDKVVACYEAGPCGYDLQRKFDAKGVRCIVVAPSLIPVKPGERIKTDRRDARKLAANLRADQLTEVIPPTEEEEVVRDLVRARESVKEDQKRARHRLQQFLLRRGLVYREGRPWTDKHAAWIRRLRFERSAEQSTFDHYLLAVETITEWVKSLDAEIETVSKTAAYAAPVSYLRCFRGIDTLTAMGIVAELHGFQRFEHPRQLMAYLGLVPGEHSSSEKPKRFGITKTGNGRVRRLLIEAAWHARLPARDSKTLRARRREQPAWVIAIAMKAQSRLHRKYWKLASRKMNPNKVVCAVARELVGFIWAVLYEDSFTVREPIAA